MYRNPVSVNEVNSGRNNFGPQRSSYAAPAAAAPQAQYQAPASQNQKFYGQVPMMSPLSPTSNPQSGCCTCGMSKKRFVLLSAAGTVSGLLVVSLVAGAIIVVLGLAGVFNEK